jgi:hypothetical protein
MTNIVAVYEARCSGYRVTINCYASDGQYNIQVITKVKRLGGNWWSEFEKWNRFNDKKIANIEFGKIVKQKTEVANDKNFRFKKVR